MGSIADRLSGKQKERLVTSSLSEGEVFRMHLGDEENVKGKNSGDDGRNKYFIIIGHDSEGNAIGFVLIDTQINPYLPDKRKDMHYPLSAKKYTFLEGINRFVDCSDFKIISNKKFTELFGKDSLKGRIQADDLSYIKTAVAEYEVSSQKMAIN